MHYNGSGVCYSNKGEYYMYICSVEYMYILLCIIHQQSRVLHACVNFVVHVDTKNVFCFVMPLPGI